MDIDEEWVDDAAMSPGLRAKLLVLKTCRNRCIKHATAETALEIAKPVLNMFSTLLEQGGSFTSDARDEYVDIPAHPTDTHRRRNSPKAKTRLRLQAAVSLLHLATVPQFAKPISQYFVRICLTLQVNIVSCQYSQADLSTRPGSMLPSPDGLFEQVDIPPERAETPARLQCDTLYCSP